MLLISYDMIYYDTILYVISYHIIIEYILYTYMYIRRCECWHEFIHVHIVNMSIHKHTYEYETQYYFDIVLHEIPLDEIV